MKHKTSRILNRILALIIAAGICLPIVFTAWQMGFFTKEPKVAVQIQAGEDAPVLYIATDYDFCPNSYYNKDGELSGLYIELMIEACNRLGMKPIFETDNWMGCRKMLEDAEVDVLLGLEIFSNMKGTLRTIPVCSDELRVYGKKEIDSAAALAGKKVALMARSVIAATYDLQCEYVEYNTNTEILEAVENGEADYGICHGAVAEKIIEKNGFHLVSGLAVAKSYPALAVQDSKPELRQKLNEVLQEMSLDGTIGRLQNKWITEFPKDTSLKDVIQQNLVFYIGFFLGTGIVLCIALSFRLNDQYQKKYIAKLLEYQEKLKRSNEETRKANQAKSEFLSHMSHDIRTPMNGIIGMTEMIKKNLKNPEKIEECLEKIDKASEHLLSLINDVLDMSKIGNDGVKLEEIPIDLDEEIEKIHAIADVQAEEKGIVFEINKKEMEHPGLLGSPGHLRRILLNLISNAMRYNRPGGRVCVEIREKGSDGTYAFLEMKVSDTGIGMSREFLENSLFKPFTQENDSIRTEYQGTGLGMSIVKELVERMHGTIQAESEEGVGTTFTVTIPLKIGTPKLPETTEEILKWDVSGKKVLAAEDNELNREIVEFMLTEAGIQYDAVENGQQALDKFMEMPAGTYDAILMDIMMPVKDGISAAKEIRNCKKADAGSIPIIAMTANAFEEDARKCLEAGMNAHLSKPLRPEELIETLARCCSQYHETKEETEK